MSSYFSLSYSLSSNRLDRAPGALSQQEVASAAKHRWNFCPLGKSLKSCDSTPQGLIGRRDLPRRQCPRAPACVWGHCSSSALISPLSSPYLFKGDKLGGSWGRGDGWGSRNATAPSLFNVTSGQSNRSCVACFCGTGKDMVVLTYNGLQVATEGLQWPQRGGRKVILGFLL